MPSANSTAAIVRARKLRNDMTGGERRLWSELRNWKRNFGLHVRKQAPVGPYVVDFLINSKRLVIEVDGEHHFTETGIKHDRKRDAWLATQGYRVIRLSTGDVEEAFEGCIEKVMKEAGLL